MTRNTFTNNKKGFSLIELCIVLAILAILAGSITPVFIKRIQVKAGEKTAVEMSVIQQAALSYFVANNAWPASITALQNAGYLNPSWVTNNPWGKAYSLTFTPLILTVSTDVLAEWTNLVARDLPSTSISGTTVSSTIPIPGAASEALPSGAIIVWDGASCPSGFSRVSALDGKFLVGDSFYNPVAGGSNTHLHGAGSYTVASHSHIVPATSNWGDSGTCIGQRLAVTSIDTARSVTKNLPTGSESPGVNGTSASADSRPEFATVLLCKKD